MVALVSNGDRDGVDGQDVTNSEMEYSMHTACTYGPGMVDTTGKNTAHNSKS
jgi:hypothetical protein